MRALQSGVELVDRALGGLLPGLPCIVAGPSGAGRTVLALQLADAALRGGKVVSFVCNEPAPFLLQQAESLGIELRPSIRSGHLALLELDADVGSLITDHGMEAFAESLVAEQPLASLVIVDPFSVLTAGIFEESRLRNAARGLVQQLSRVEVLLTVETERMALQQGLERVLFEICGSFASLERDEGGARSIVVEKSRTGPLDEERVGFAVGDGGTRVVALPVPAVTPSPAPAPEAAAEPVPDTAPLERAPTPPPDALAPASASEPSARVEARALDEAGCQPLVLVVDDDFGTRDLLSKWLEGRYRVVTARDAFDAMTVFLNSRPDLVVLALMMPRVTGYELLSAFQRTGTTIPRLVVSSRVGRAADRLSPLVLGATDILAKPVERFEFLHKVETLLRLAAPTSSFVDPLEAEALFATISSSRLLEAEAFNLRLARACSFGERCGHPSALVALSASSSQEIDALIEIADTELRFEDAILRVSKRRVVILLVATEPADGPGVVDRLIASHSDWAERPPRMRWRILEAQPLSDEYDWHEPFRDEDPEGEGT